MVTVSEAEVLPPDVEAKRPPAKLDVRVTDYHVGARVAEGVLLLNGDRAQGRAR